MTRSRLQAAELRTACAEYTLTVPATLDDCREIYEDLKARRVAPTLDVVLVNERTIRVTIGEHESTQSIDIQA